MNVYLQTIGCRLNQAELEQYALELQTAGHQLVTSPEQADMAIVNTCTVTNAAAADSRMKIRQIARSGTADITVTGCWATMEPEHAITLSNVKRIILNSKKDDLVSLILNNGLDQIDSTPSLIESNPTARLRTRAFIKVQDGCDNHCTFCITAVARSHIRSKTISEILATIQKLSSLKSNPQTIKSFNSVGHVKSVNNSHTSSSIEANGSIKEIVLTGVNLSAWGKDLRPHLRLKNLIQALLEKTDIPRIRLSSLEPWNLEPDFFNLWEDRRMCRQIHLPLQSGSKTTLRRMARKITPYEYANIVAAARQKIPDLAVTTDIIAGFPGENESEFLESLYFINSIQFAHGHVFTYSAREGTAASRMPDQVPYHIRKDRNTLYREALKESSSNYRKTFIGHILPVLWESRAPLESGQWQLNGHTDNYIRVSAHYSQPLWNQISEVRITELTDNGLNGEII